VRPQAATDAIGTARAWLESFRGPHGLCAILEECVREEQAIDECMVQGRSSGVHVRGGTTSDPTASAALSLIERRRRVSERREGLERQMETVGVVLAQCPHGDVLDNYYLQPDDDITWSALAGEYGVNTRTILRWRDSAVQWVAEHAAWGW
jgi:hypothetical protein